ncbi:unnamed protein product, partial [Trichobilharzia regenti]
MEKLVKTGYRSLIIVNNTNEYRVDGIISISDVLRFTVLQQLRMTSTRLQPPSVAEVADEYDELKRNGGSKKKKKGEKDKSGENLKPTTNTTTSTTTTTSNPPVSSSSGCSSQTKNKKSSNKKSTTTTMATTTTNTITTMTPTTTGTTTSRNSPITTTITTATTKTSITITTVPGGVTSSPEHVAGIHSSVPSIHHEKKKHTAKGTKLDNSVKPQSSDTTDSRINKSSSKQKVDNEKKIAPPSVNIILTTPPTTPTTH